MEGKQSLDLNAPFIYHLQPSQKGLQGVWSTSANSKLTTDLAQKCRSRQEDVLPPPHTHTHTSLACRDQRGGKGRNFILQGERRAEAPTSAVGWPDCSVRSPSPQEASLPAAPSGEGKMPAGRSTEQGRRKPPALFTKAGKSLQPEHKPVWQRQRAESHLRCGC